MDGVADSEGKITGHAAQKLRQLDMAGLAGFFGKHAAAVQGDACGIDGNRVGQLLQRCFHMQGDGGGDLGAAVVGDGGDGLHGGGAGLAFKGGYTDAYGKHQHQAQSKNQKSLHIAVSFRKIRAITHFHLSIVTYCIHKSKHQDFLQERLEPWISVILFKNGLL